MKNSKRYVKCDMCDATGYIEYNTFVEVRQNTRHQNVAEEIQLLQLLNSCSSSSLISFTDGVFTRSSKRLALARVF